MCELFCLSSRVPTIATFSLRRFAARGGLNGHTVDGWGLAFYDGRDVRLYREPEPAGDSTWLAFIEHRRIASTLLLSHIRRATAGRVSLENTQPFARELAGRIHCFAHNGRLPGIETLQCAAGGKFQPVGETDSESAFCILLDRLSALWDFDSTPSLDSRLAIVGRFAAALRELGPANFLYADSDAVFAHADRRIQVDGAITPPGLWRLHRDCAVDRDALAQSGVLITATPGPQQLALLASVPLSDEPWQPLARGEVIAVKAGVMQAAITV